ncbi:MAG: DUF2442 domain-containing protein [Caldilineaceae bacterium]|nr:DUF2442 domain-containing protein [Caldilineaceae bacterium]MCB0138277.1 DUF2442 domain-containing protein [Caldilineaceae bacterium]
MNAVMIDVRDLAIQDVSVTDEDLSVDLTDGRSLTVPLVWFPRLMHGTVDERNQWRLIGRGAGIHWPELDEDISLEGLILGRPSNESQKSLSRWLESRSSE